MAIRILAAALLIGTLAGSGLAAEPARAPTVKTPAPPGPPKVAVTLLGEGASIEPGASFWVGLRQRIAPGWHTYWTNPGDSGRAPHPGLGRCPRAGKPARSSSRSPSACRSAR